MPVPPPDNPQVCKVTLVMKRDQRQFLNTFHVDKATDWTLPEMITLANDFGTWWQNSYRQAIPDDIALTQVQVRKYDPTAPLGFDLEVNPAIAGALPGEVLPGNVTSTVSWRTGLAGRRFRGRIYIPGLNEGNVDSQDLISSTIVNLLSSAAISLISSALTNGKLTIFHAPKEVPTPFDNTSTDVLTSVVENIVDSQRRRLPGRGR